MYTVTIPLTRTAPVTINWGDGTADVTYPATGPISYTYQTSGQFDITVFLTSSTHMTNFTTNGWADRAKVVDVKQWGESNFTGGSNFTQTSLTTISAPDYPRRLVNASNFFLNCTQLQDLGNFRIDNVTNTSGMFRNCSIFNGSVSKLNTTLVTDMSFMFNFALAFNQPVSNFNTSLVTNMQGMFSDARAFNQPISTFNTSNVTNFGTMFYQAVEFNQSVSNFDTSKATTMAQMFQLASKFNQSVSNFNTANVTNMDRMFRNATIFNQSVSNFNTANVTNMSEMFNSAFAFNQPVPFNTNKVTNMFGVFGGATSFNQAINFSIPLVANMNFFITNSAMNTTNVDNMLINFAGQTTQNNINLGPMRPRTSASDAAKATLVSRGWTASGW